jgi:acetylornithine deacetylase/succinyl-diaminopimelate desuccinylase-like protein
MTMRSEAIDWDAVTQEATDLLSRYLQVNTSNPPGNESAAVDFLAPLLTAEGIPVERYEPVAGRESMRAVLPGDGSARPLILMNHTDVVPVEREFWDVEPFGGLIRDGYIWGRGAIDMKGMGILELMSVLLLKRLRIPLKRDVVFFAIADEEAGSEVGIEWFGREHPELLQSGYCINEGSYGWADLLGSSRPIFGFAPTEKGPCWLQLHVEGPPGHGSLPHDQNALAVLARALYRIDTWQRPRIVLPELRPFFDELGRAGLLPIGDPDALEQVIRGDRMMNAITSNTISLTTCHSGIKANVIPAMAEASLDCRLLPGTDHREWIEEVRAVIDDPRVRIDLMFQSETEPSDPDSELVHIAGDIVREYEEEALFVPTISSWFTDSRVCRRLGVPAYGFIPFLLTAEDYAGMHGHNERVSIQNLRMGTQILFELTRRLAAAD